MRELHKRHDTHDEFVRAALGQWIIRDDDDEEEESIYRVHVPGRLSLSVWMMLVLTETW